VPDVAFVTSPGQPEPLLELAETLRCELDLQGIPSSVSTDGFPPPRSDLVYVLVDPRSFVELRGLRALPEDAVLRRTIFLGAERPRDIIDDDHLALLRLAGAVFDLDVRSVAAMRRHGVAARTLKPGYSRLRDHYNVDDPRPIDVMFVGTQSPRRAERLAQFAPVLARYNCLLHVSPAGPDGWPGSAYLGDARRPLLAQTKVVINLHRDDDAEFEWLRALDAIEAGAVVVSEHSSGTGALEPGRHLLVASADSLPYVVESLLRDGERLRRIRAEAYERLRTWIPFALPASIFRAAVIEILGQPLHAGVKLSGRTAVRGDGGDSAPETHGTSDRVVAADPAMERRLDEAHAELLEVREELIQVRRQATALRRELVTGQQTELRMATPAWRARRKPRVSVVMVSSDDCPKIRPTLDSIGMSRLSDLEIVIVDAGSTDGSAKTADGWLRDHPRIPGVLISARGAQGRGAGRNVALQFTRGDSVLILDPGTTLYPHCIQRLADTLGSMDQTVALAYPVIEVSSDSEWFVREGGDWLLNAFPWQSDQLRTGNTVQSPYLIRARSLRTLGGFASHPALDGFEDYDVMCRVAEQGWRGQLLAQTLARRSERPGSTCLPTIRPAEGPATRALIARAPRAMANAFTR
jgi:Glycosyl transferase family 2